MGCYFLLQGIFPTQGSNPCFLHLQEDSLPLSHHGSPSGVYPSLPLPFWIQTALNLMLFFPTKYILGISVLLLIVTYCILFNGCANFVMWMCHILFIQNTMDGQLVAQSCLTLWDPLDCSPPGSSAHGILQARFWNGLPSPSQPKDRTWVSHIAGRFIWDTYYLLRTLKRTFLAIYLAYLESLYIPWRNADSGAMRSIFVFDKFWPVSLPTPVISGLKVYKCVYFLTTLSVRNIICINY